MSETFNIEIFSPEKKLLTDKTSSVTIPSYEGDMTILSNHISIITFWSSLDKSSSLTSPFSKLVIKSLIRCSILE